MSLKTPEPFAPGKDVAENWTRWEQRYRFYSVAAELNLKPVPLQRATLLHVIGEEALEVYNTFTFAGDADAVTVEIILEKFRSYYRPYKNTTYQRYLFFNTNQTKGQSVDVYITELRKRAKECEFEQLTDSLIRDRLICGMTDGIVREALLREHNLTLAKAVDLCRAAEMSREQTRTMTPRSEVEEEKSLLCEVSASARTDQRPFNRRIPARQNARQNEEVLLASNRKPCRGCGRYHPSRACPAVGKQCYKCKKENHFSKVCKSKVVYVVEQADPDTQSDNGESDDYFIGALQQGKLTDSSNRIEWIEQVKIGDSLVKAKVDTGSQANVISAKLLAQCAPNAKLTKARSTLSTYTGEPIRLKGKCHLTCEWKGKLYVLCFHVVYLDAPPIIGLRASEDFGLIKRVHAVTVQTPKTLSPILTQFEDVFEGLGTLPELCHVHLKENAVPIVEAPRRVPHALQQAVKLELDKMEKDGIICKVTEPSEWASPIAIVPKPNGKVRICMDPRILNEAILKEQHNIPVIEDMLTKMVGCTVFTVLDAASAFWQVRLDEQSSKICTVTTPFGRYRFLRMPYGIKNAPEVFQRIIDNLYAGKEKVCAYFDDVLVGGVDQKDHDERLTAVLVVAQRAGLKFSKDKLQLSLNEVEYVGQKVSSKGVMPCLSNVEAITSVLSPRSKTELQRILGLITYLGKFLPNLSDKTGYLRSLLPKSVEWCWDSNAEKELNSLKQLVTEAPVLTFFNPKLPIVVSVDASRYGLGAVLLQEGKPVIYASAALNTTQQKYAQIEKEMLAIVFACQRFHYYVYGYGIEVQTDHLPLLTIVKKKFEDISPRLQRMLLKLQQYSITLTYVPGKNLHVADALSRAPLSSQTVDTTYMEEDVPFLKVNLLVTMTGNRTQTLVKETELDGELQKVIQYVRTGWPTHIKSCEAAAKPYWSVRGELYEEKGLLCKGQCLVIPRKCREEILNVIHNSHQGIGATRRRARESLYWPGMATEIESLIGNCSLCQEFQRQNSKEPLLQHPVPDRAWQKIGVDFFHCCEKTYLLVIDYFSKFVELQLLSRTNASSVIVSLKSMFARYGIPEEIMSDNGPPFNSEEIRTFTQEWGVMHTTSSPYHAQSNGMVERSVQTVKTMLKKAIKSESDPYLVLMDYRSTPTQGLPSPAEILMGRKLRTMLPTKEKSLRGFKNEAVKNELRNRQKKQQERHGERKELHPLKREDKVWVTTPKGWKPAQVQQVGPEPRSYLLDTEEGRTVRRNRIHLRKRTGEKQPLTSKQEPWQEDTNRKRFFLTRQAVQESQEERSDNSRCEDSGRQTRHQRNVRNEELRQEQAGHQGQVTRIGRRVVCPTRYLD